MVPFKKEPKPLAIIPLDHVPLPRVPPSRPPTPPPPEGKKQVMYAQPYDRRREAALEKPIRVPSHVYVQKPKAGEWLTRMRCDEHGNTRVHRYTNAPPSRVVINGVRAKEDH